MELKPGYKQTEVGMIPEDWEITPAEAVCELIVDCKNRTPPVVDASEFAVVRTPNVRDGKFVKEELRFTDEVSFREWTMRTVPKVGDVLITREAPLGEVCLVPSGMNVCLGQRMMLYRSDKSKITSNFLLYALMSAQVKTNLLKKIGGSTVGHAKVDDIRFLELPLPPLTEQHSIAAALSDVDALIQSQDAVIAKKRDIKQAAMQQLLSGKQRMPGFNGEWKAKKLGDLALFLKGKGLPKSDIQSHGAEPCIHYGELFTKYPETITRVQSRTNVGIGVFRSVANDVLMPTSDVTPNGLAKASCVQQSGVILGGDILVIRVQSNVLNGSFLSYVIRWQREQIMQLVSGSTVYHLYGTDMKIFSFLLPEIEEQNSIVQILSDMDAEIVALEAQRAKTGVLKQGMMQELLTGKTRLF